MNKYRIENPNNKDVREYKSRTTGAKSGFKKGSDLGYEGNHKRGIAAENRVNGSIRGKESYTPRGSRYSVSHTDKKGNISTYSYSTKNPIIKLTKN